MNNSKKMAMLPEWAEQEAVVLAWPHKDTDWRYNLDQTKATYLDLINSINATGTPILLLCPESEVDNTKGLLDARSHIAQPNKVLIIPAQYNDTWVRDYAFITVSDNEKNYPINFEFNGWGKKFDATLDNQINHLLGSLCQQSLQSHNLVLEGGAIEIDENQHLLSTQSCLFNPKRNPNYTKELYCQFFQDVLGAKQVNLFQNGHLQGDDTDGHIDTLARFTPLMGIVFQGAENRPQDSHFVDLMKLKFELQQAFPQHTLYSLPLPYVENLEKERLPASYANFLILNKRILLPIYGQAEDDTAIAVTKKAFPNYQVMPINCLSLVQQYGSLHCVTMQIPFNTLKPEIVELASQGVSVLDI